MPRLLLYGASGLVILPRLIAMAVVIMVGQGLENRREF